MGGEGEGNNKTNKTNEELNKSGRKYNPVRRKLKASSRAFTFAENLHALAGNSSSALDKNARRLSDAVTGINQMIERLSEPDTNGKYPDLDENTLLDLNRKYAEALKECDNMINGKDLSGWTKRSQKYKTYSDMAALTRKFLASDLKYLETANAKLGGTLPEVISNARSVVLDAGEVKFGKLSGEQSSRIPMTVTTQSGKKVKGLFTVKDDFDPVANLNSLFDKMAVVPELKPLMDQVKLKDDFNNYDQLLARYRTVSKMIEEKDGAVDPMSILSVMTDLQHPELRQMEGYKKAEAFLKKPDIKKEISAAFTDNYKPVMGKLNVNYIHGGIRSANLDTKNAASSVIAALLGRSDLFANSVPVRMKKGDKIIEGTFMEFAKGIDLKRIGSSWSDPENAPYYMLDMEKGVNGRPVVKDIFDMEFVDYIIGNYDCHGANVLYDIQAGNHGYYLNGIKRIDLDNTFPEADVDPKGLKCLASVEKMKVISDSMAQRVKNLDGETIKLALRNYMKSPANPMGLSEAAVDKMIARLENAKSRISEKQKGLKPGTLKVIKDSEWKTYSLEKLCPRTSDSSSSQIQAWLGDKNGVSREAEKREKQLLNNAGKIDMPEVKAEAEEKTAKKLDYAVMERKLRKVEEDLNAVSKVWNGSEQYRNMHGKAKELLALLEEHNKNPQGDEAEFKEKLSKGLNEFGESTELYLRKKRGEGQKAANSKNAMKRVKAANSAADFVAKHENRIEAKKEEESKQKGPLL